MDGGTTADGSLVDGWIAGIAVAAAGFTAVAGSIWLTPGSPFACDLPNPGGFLLCAWTRRFVANAVLVGIGLVVGAVVLAIPLGLAGALFRAIDE